VAWLVVDGELVALAGAAAAPTWSRSRLYRGGGRRSRRRGAGDGLVGGAGARSASAAVSAIAVVACLVVGGELAALAARGALGRGGEVLARGTPAEVAASTRR
jgi:hypothetical protein